MIVKYALRLDPTKFMLIWSTKRVIRRYLEILIHFYTTYLLKQWSVMMTLNTVLHNFCRWYGRKYKIKPLHTPCLNYCANNTMYGTDWNCLLSAKPCPKKHINKLTMPQLLCQQKKYMALTGTAVCQMLSREACQPTYAIAMPELVYQQHNVWYWPWNRHLAEPWLVEECRQVSALVADPILTWTQALQMPMPRHSEIPGCQNEAMPLWEQIKIMS